MLWHWLIQRQLAARRRDMRRPPLHDLRVPTKVPEEIEVVAVGLIMSDLSVEREPARRCRLGVLSKFRWAFDDCLTMRADGLFELTDAVLCADGPVASLVELCLAEVHRRGHGGLYDSLNNGRIDYARFRNLVAAREIPRYDCRIVLAIDVSNWLRPDAATCPDRLFCHTYGRGKGNAQMIPGWPYSFVAALETGRTSWTAILDAVRLGPLDDDGTMAAKQLREVVERLIAPTLPGARGDGGKAMTRSDLRRTTISTGRSARSNANRGPL